MHPSKTIGVLGTAAIVVALTASAAAAAGSAKPSRAEPNAGTSAARSSAPASGAARTRGIEATPSRRDSGSSQDMTLKGGVEGTVFRTLTVEGEDRIHAEVERPTLELDMDPERAPGLDWGNARDVLDRTTPDLVAPLLVVAARAASPWVARPWLSHFAGGAVARFRPDITGAERWTLTVVNARAEPVAVFEGKGDPPREIAWDGRSTTGAPVMPGVSYSYVFEARDKAGNKRNFIGEGFRVSAFRYTTADGPVLVFSGRELVSTTFDAAAGAPPIVLEAATAVNQVAGTRPIRIEVTARSDEEANALAQRLTRWMAPYVIGDPVRIRSVARVQSDAPEGASVQIVVAK